jgi:hypothetical protein
MKNALREALLNAKHYKAAGITELSIGKYAQIDDDPPWHLATSFKSGGTHRLDIATSGWFKGTDPESGMNLSWSFDIEPREANGMGSYQIDTRACEEVLRQLPKAVALEFRKYLADCAEKVMKRALEYQGYADRQYQDARTLITLAGFSDTSAAEPK